MKDKTSHLNMELERERTQNRLMSEQLQQTRSRSTSPARSAVIFSALSILYSLRIKSHFENQIFAHTDDFFFSFPPPA